MMATSTTCDAEPNLTECAVCHDTYTVPKILPCSHLLCRECLVTWLQSQQQAACPLCRCAIVDPTKQDGECYCIEEVADGLPTDLAMTALVEAETLLSKQHVCCVCDDVAAVALCLECRDMFCQQCCKTHKKQSATKHHQVEELSSLTIKKLATHHPATCPDHMDKVSELYCPVHDSFFCVLCVDTAHRNCTGLVNLQSKVGEMTTELAQLSNKLVEAVAKEDARLRLLDDRKEALEKESQAAMLEMKDICDRLKAAIDARFVHFKNTTLKLLSDINAEICSVKQHIIQKRSKMVTLKSMADFYKMFNEHNQFKDMVHLIKGRIKDFDFVYSRSNVLQFNYTLTKNINHKAVAVFEKQLSQIGEIELTKGKNILMDEVNTTVSCNTYTGPVHQRSDSKIKFDPMTAIASCGLPIETYSREDSEAPSITGLAFSESNDELYLVDKTNRSIKFFSLNSNSMISTLKLEVQPYGLTLVSDDLLAVTSWSDNAITLIDIKDRKKAQVMETIKTTRTYIGAEVLRRSTVAPTLVVGSGEDCLGPASVDVIDLKGKLIRTIITSQSLPELKWPGNLHVDEERDLLFISDWDADCVFGVQLSTSRVLHNLKCPQLSGPGQVCTDSERNLYVASREGNCVLVRSVGGVWRLLISGTVQGQGEFVHPTRICVTTTSLIVNWRDSDGTRSILKRYKLCNK